MIQVLVNLLNAHPTFLLQRPFLDENFEQSNSTGGEVGAEVGEGVGGGATGADVGALVGCYRQMITDEILKGKNTCRF